MRSDAPFHRRWLDALDGPASPRFVALTLGLAGLLWAFVWRADYTNFFTICNHDSGASLRLDEIVAAGSKPGTDFFYYYGPLPILVGRVFFLVCGRSPFTLLVLLVLLGGAFSLGLATILSAFAPTRLAVLLVAVTISLTIAPGVPTHALEAAVLVWAVAMRVRGRNAAAVGLAASAIFVKISMGTVILTELGGLVVLDAIRTRSRRPLVALCAAPVAAAVWLVVSLLAFGGPSLAAVFDPTAGAAAYRAADLGFFREGRAFWHPAGHTLGWYLGGLPGPWIVATLLLVAAAPRAATRLLRAAGAGAPRERDRAMVADETNLVAAVANLAFIVVFFGPSAGVNYYAWVPLVGVMPWLARARFGRGEAPAWVPAGWAAASLALCLSATGALRQFAQFVREPREQIGGVSFPVDEAAEWKTTLALAHATGAGTVTAVARAANFALIDPSIREGSYWMMMGGMRATRSIGDLVALARSGDTMFVPKIDLPVLLGVPEFHALVADSERLHEGKYFVLLRRREGSPSL